METLEQEFLKMAIEYKQEYETTKWWKFKKRRILKYKWRKAVNCMIKYGKLKEKP